MQPDLRAVAWQVFQHPVPYCDEEEAFWIRNDLAPGARRDWPLVPVSGGRGIAADPCRTPDCAGGCDRAGAS
ncbi:MAG TPA: hypothetical protein DCP73_12705 [Chloroflexi bacterium]|nr:hypothetical protein [Chloroflexota bacterium]